MNRLWSTLTHASSALTLHDNAHCAAPDLNPKSYSDHQESKSNRQKSRLQRFQSWHWSSQGLIYKDTQSQAGAAFEHKQRWTPRRKPLSVSGSWQMKLLFSPVNTSCQRSIWSQSTGDVSQVVHFFLPFFKCCICVWGATHAGRHT